jgi:hypothetical protein
MNDLAGTLSANREAIDVYIDLARSLDSDRWSLPVRKDGWSPAQITEHLSRVYDFGTGAIDGTLSARPLPRMMRWMLGRFWFAPAIRNGKFTGRTRAPKVFAPTLPGGEASELLPRLRVASERFAAAAEAALSGGATTLEHPMFGRIGVLDFLRLQVIHVRHHRAQLPRIPS